MPKDGRLDLTLFGATGFTGWIAAQYICKHAPPDLQWAIAGRSQDKLTAKLRDIRRDYPDRALPETIVASLDEVSAIKLASSSKVVVTTVGPFCRYGSKLVKACAEAGTHYVDCTGEYPWVLEMIEKHHETAKQTGAFIIPQCAFDSAPADIVSYKVANFIRENYKASTKDLTFSLHNLNGGASGGTMESFFSTIEVYGLSGLARATKPLALSPIKRPYSAPSHLPVFTHPTLGKLTPWIQASPDRATVMRSWGLTQQHAPEKSWGNNFSFTEYKRVKSSFEGLATWITIGLLSVGVLIKPFRWFARKVITQPGFGPDQNFDINRKGNLDWKAVGVVDDDGGENKGKKVLGTFTYDGGDAYALTGLFIVEAALHLLDMEKGRSKKEGLGQTIGGGLLTPICLGEGFFKRLDGAGIKIDAREL
ncbi:hypothetical protein TWF106_011621 [Orbilia oligospora]|uniref:Saccharopine dehydrogenase NADP binding domain-containing protein n=1 Tax=Orbilia oligospora TaxID=2813651 RepID=A0A6G1LTS8_ORBOL|nr:hypothetical protein TWF788_011436 [Orbilia oligospora]KAF3205009.1 hypothetical protein TWF679_009446 [Orbilia oligospora]KAF3207807.1 hypothetical protein TWF106_011621 [Orbilia oligospora]KAF3222003.1 hypothetical protein TWF191_007048 [Orbilia oligospora]KAF3234168.1 hypothetical protein TWF192_001633 [Orbilia oligospora]